MIKITGECRYDGECGFRTIDGVKALYEPITTKKMNRIISAAEIISANYYKYINEDSAKEELRKSIIDYKKWLEEIEITK